MNTVNQLEEKYPASSEKIEMGITHMIGVMGMRYDEARSLGDHILQVQAAHSLWMMLELINMQTIVLGTVTHTSLVMNNNRQMIATLIKKDLGFDPILDLEQGAKVVTMQYDSLDAWFKAAGLHDKGSEI